MSNGDFAQNFNPSYQIKLKYQTIHVSQIIRFLHSYKAHTANMISCHHHHRSLLYSSTIQKKSLNK